MDFWSLLHPGADLLDPGGEVDCKLEGVLVRIAGIVDRKLEPRETDVWCKRNWRGLQLQKKLCEVEEVEIDGDGSEGWIRDV